MVKIRSWGRLQASDQEIVVLRDRTDLANCLRSDKKGIAYGMGRSYGDVCLSPGGIAWQTTGLNRFIGFDPASGSLKCEAGVLLRDIQEVFIPRGWALPVTPGTQLITVGGAIANDVHGKNHHRCGSFGDHVRWLKLIRTDGQVIECSADRQPHWLAATIGGLGLTGIISEVEIQLRRIPGPWLTTETIPYGSLNEFFELADGSENGWEQTVSWIDCLSSSGRGLFMRANPAKAQDRPPPSHKSKNFPCVPPGSLINRLSVKPFNELYFQLGKTRAGMRHDYYRNFSYPLDDVRNWNKVYGPRGFYQYQSVIPRAVGRDATGAMLKLIARSGQGSCLAVLKTFGTRLPVGMMSFPRPGVTLALDFPNNGSKTLELFTRLDAIIKEAGGCLYAAKDARMPRDLFEAGYPRLRDFLGFRDPGLSSAFSQRLMGC